MSRAERVAIVGSREATPEQLAAVARLVASLPADTVVVTGCADGIDEAARRAAYRRGLEVVVCYAAWRVRGKAAGPSRNTLIVDICDRLVAFPSAASVGTHDTIRKARAAGKRVEVIEC